MVKLMLLMAFVLYLPAVTISQTISLSGKQVTLPAAFAAIKKQTGYSLVFNPRILDTLATISINAKDQPLETFLKVILAKQSLRYRIVGTSIIVSRKENNASGSEGNDGDPNLIIPDDLHGVIFEKNRRPLSGVSVVLKRTGRGTQTDVTGKFTLKGVSAKDTIVCSMIGYQTTSILAVKTEVPMAVLMHIAVNELDEMVVQAYGVTSKRMATGNITKISGEEIRQQPVMNPLLALQGRVPGMVVIPTTGYASSPVKVEIRGRNSLNKNFSGEPLYVVDGIPLSVLDLKGPAANEFGLSKGYSQGGFSATGGQSVLFGMNPNDIESIEVLKDGDATAIYGSRAANGVILITTKKPKPGKPAFNLRVEQGISDVPRHIDMLNTQEYLDIRRQALKNDGVIPTPSNAPDLMLWDTTRYTDWQKELFKTGVNTSINAGISGGDNRTTYSLSTGYFMKKEMLNSSGKDEALNVRLNLGVRSQNQKFSLSVTASYMSTFVDAVVLHEDMISLPPNAPAILDSKGALNYAEWGGPLGNLYPFSTLRMPNTSKFNNLASNIDIRYELLKGLSLSATAGYSSGQGTNESLVPIASRDPIENPTGEATFGTTKNTTWIIESRLNFSKYIGKGTLQILLAGNLENTTTSGVTMMGSGYTNDELLGSISNAVSQRSSDNFGQYKFASLKGRIEYNWARKYAITLNGSRDGSSKFAPDRLYGNFGSAGVSWILSEEKWMKRFLPSWFNFIKLRTSYGLTGSNAIGDYQYLSQWGVSVTGNTALPVYDGVMPYVPKQAVNQQYHWEANKKFDASVSLGLLKERIGLTLGVYRHISDDQLINQPTPSFSGFTTVVTNRQGKVENKGLEASLTATLVQNKNFSWAISYAFSYNINRLLSYPGLEYSRHATAYRIGESLSTIYLLHYLGIDPLTGDYSFEDHNKDGEIIPIGGFMPGSVKDDSYIAFNPDLAFDGSVSSNLKYKNAALGFVLTYSAKKLPNPFLVNAVGGMKNLYMPASELDNFWRKPGDQTKYPRFTNGALSDIRASDGYYSEGSFLRVQNLFFSYSLPDKLIHKTALTGCSFSVALNNVFTITRYKGIDPQVLSLSGPPPPRIINASLNVTF
jgi:TonB-linked SusC/RagA family outer membrane protein